MFEGAESFASDLSSWDVKEVVNTGAMFKGAAKFNSDLSGWNVESARWFSGMFEDAALFNQNLCAWGPLMTDLYNQRPHDVSNMFVGTSCPLELDPDLSGSTPKPFCHSCVSQENRCFSDNLDLKIAVQEYVNDPSPNSQVAQAHGYPINTWCVGQIVDFTGIFEGLSNFNEPLVDWDVSAATTMKDMFRGAAAFNQDLSEWEVSSVTNMFRMFNGAESFNGDVSSWDVRSVEDMRQMFWDAESFDQDLCAWGSDLDMHVRVFNTFLGTNCPVEADPEISNKEQGPFCYVC